MSSLSCTKLTMFTIIGVIVQIIGLSLFVFGFFPAKPALSGFSGPESFRPPSFDPVRNENHSMANLPPDELRSLYQELSGFPPFDQLILMVIDGLPAEFVLGKDGKPPRTELIEAMPYTQSLIASGMAVGYHAKAAPPTVTMPRLKAMVSGAIGGFMDVAFNFNTQALLDDNLIDQFFKIGRKMVMLGDDTWLKLFPGLFTRHDGVSSFFVKDTVQVDQNVSRHLSDELGRYDWDLLILHYLGLDHVGHIGGRNSVLMAPKLTEMDEVVKMIHTGRILNQMNNHGKTLLVVVSDHGMTESGNHGGSSYEETDSLAIFIGLNDVSGYTSSTKNTVYQVDIAPTLALLFGVPIPKNNVGILILETFGHLADAVFLHNSWMSKNLSRLEHGEEYRTVVGAYNEFLRIASEWLSHRATDKPVNLLAFGVAAMILSCLILLSLLFLICKEDFDTEKKCLSKAENKSMRTWHLDETFTVVVIFILVISMGSSSMVEEEQYIWHFVSSTLTLLLLRKALQSLQVVRAESLFNLFKGQNKINGFQTISIALLLVSGRILRGWHQGGVNWTDLPDISKWLEQAGDDHVLKAIQLVAGLLVIALSLMSLFVLDLHRILVAVIGFCFLTPGLLVLQHIMLNQDSMFAPSSFSTTLVQTIYTVLGFGTFGIAVASPWLSPILTSKTCSYNSYMSTSDHKEFLLELRNSSFLIGWAYICFWCLLQLLLQQPINSTPILLLLAQVFVGMSYCFYSGPHHKQWIEVALFYYMGMAGHYALGNSNSLATIDVAGAFIGISSHSTILSGILMFMITYASPMLAILSMVMYISVKGINYLALPLNVDSGQLLKRLLGFPCLLPLGLNSILLVADTVVLILMRNHLFVWSVFSPKYLYVCAMTVCVYIGVSIVAATVIYTYWVLSFKRIMHGSASIKGEK
ncbi:Type I phosphodiesterase/nucleotide pyrophosphatase/phosphate transferase [Parasponia andersonii]|uniref:Type I phosphodiesterase/nucleotide pyrophosphatase/phosphate transferase n=1 Tax=Parasponia andersonii TaxID=3476 RepID=A0A2P5AQG9_PARAD|nr:Type I phosphodiesterase/nucleotide pyrophosphatase/phosphate transferase [Parasponia andersonii]